MESVQLESRQNFFTVRVVKEWNALPENVRRQTSINAFKNTYDDWRQTQRRRDEEIERRENRWRNKNNIAKVIKRSEVPAMSTKVDLARRVRTLNSFWQKEPKIRWASALKSCSGPYRWQKFKVGDENVLGSGGAMAIC